MTKDEALSRLDTYAGMNDSERDAAIVTALEHGATREEVAAQIEMSVDELISAHGLAVKNAGKLGHFRHPADPPTVVDVDED